MSVFRVTTRNLTDEAQQFAESFSDAGRTQTEYLEFAGEVFVLLQELLAVGGGVSLDEVLQLGQTKRHQHLPRHGREIKRSDLG